MLIHNTKFVKDEDSLKKYTNLKDNFICFDLIIKIALNKEVQFTIDDRQMLLEMMYHVSLDAIANKKND